MLKDLGQFGDFAGTLKKVQEVQTKLAKAREMLEEAEVVGESGAGLVKARVSGTKVLKSLEIDPSLLEPANRETVEDLVVAAVRDGFAKADKLSKEQVADATGLPLGTGLPW